MFFPKVSIIIPVYNWSNYLSEAIESALNQTYTNVEVLVINDGSKDNWATEKIALSYGNKIKYIHKENGWVATALNKWIEEMDWEYFSWLSHDDLYYPNKIDEQIKVLKKLEDKNTILSSNYELINEKWELIKTININYSSDELLYKLLIHSFLNWCTLLINKNVFNDIWVFETSLKTTQDYHLWFRIIKKFNFINVNKALVKSRLHPWQDTNTKLQLVALEREELEKFVLNSFTLDEIKKSFWKKIPNFIFYIILNYQLYKPKVISKILIIFRKIWLYSVISSFWRKFILEFNNK